MENIYFLCYIHMDKAKEDILKSVYYNPESGFVSAVKLWHKVKHHKITLKETKDWINKQETQQIFSKQPKQFNAIIGGDHDYQIDLMFSPKYKLQNKDYNTIMNVINITSRFAYSVPMKGKTQPEVNRAFAIVYKKIPKIVNMTSDNESSLKNVMKKHSEITHWLVEPEEKNRVGIVERFNRTIRQLINRYLKTHHTKTWYMVLPSLMRNYNSTIHSTIGIAPNDFKPKDGDRIRKEAEIRGMIGKEQTLALKVGDSVRVLKKKAQFAKGSETYSKGVYKIEKVDKLSFILRNAKGLLLKKRYKNWELKVVAELYDKPSVNIPEVKHSSKAIKKVNTFKKKQMNSNIGKVTDYGEIIPENHRLKPTNQNRKDPHQVLGKRVRIRWDDGEYDGVVKRYIISRGLYVVHYDDKTKEKEKYDKNTWTILT